MKPYSSFAGERLLEMYNQFLDVLGPSHWWPATTPLEVVIGAVLTQNTAWSNVEKALANLAEAGILQRKPAASHSEQAENARHSGETLLALPDEALGELIRPSGYYRLKTGRLKAVLRYFQETCQFDLKAFGRSSHTSEALRANLLKLYGVGPETADSILLYALERPSFVVDAYTMRLLGRHALLPSARADYHLTRQLFMKSLPQDVTLFNEYHALIVRACKEWCLKSNPRCIRCPLGLGQVAADPLYTMSALCRNDKSMPGCHKTS